MIHLLCTSYHGFRSDFTELIGLTSSDIELNVSNLKVGALLQDSSSYLKERHQKLVLNQGKIDSLA